MITQNTEINSYNPHFDVHTLSNLCPLTASCFKDQQNKKLHNSLQKQAQMLTSLIAGLGAAILLVNDQGKVELTNRKFCSLVGTLKTPEELRGCDASAIMNEASSLFTDGCDFLDAVNEISKNRVAVCEQKLSTRAGQFYQRDFIPIRDEDCYLGCVWIYQNITATVIANHELQAQQEFYEKVLSNIPAEISVLNKRQEYMFINPFEIRDPQTRSWLIGNTDVDLCFRSDKPAWVAARRQHLFSEMLDTGQQKAWEEQAIDEEGNITYQDRKFFPVTDHNGDLEFAIGFSSDITQSKKAEQANRATEERYRDLFNYSQALILTHDLQGRITRANPAVCSLVDCSESDLLGRSISLFMRSGQTADFENLYIREILNSKKAEGVFDVVTTKGEAKSLLFNNYLVGEGDSAYIIGFAQDITFRVQAERELKLAKKISEDLANAKTRFLAEMSHEIRTPLNGILGISQLLSTTILSEEQAKQQGYLNESANNLLMIVNDVLDLEKITSGKLTIESVPFDVSAKVIAAFSCFQPMAAAKQIKLNLENRLPDDMLVSGDPFRLLQVINNLLSNGIKFTERGSVTLTLEATEKITDRATVRFTVEDTGIGIPPEQLRQLFEPFVQGRTDISRRFGGTGLGLVISRQLVSLLKGNLVVESKEHQGSEFHFTLSFPLLKKSEPQPLLPVINENLRGQRILVAEDIALNQIIVRNFLEGFGCMVAIAGNGLAAVEMVESEYFDLVLMDLQMPVMNGLEATALIRANPDRRISSIPIIALTANAIKGVREECYSARMNDYITKPYKKEELFFSLHKALIPYNP